MQKKSERGWNVRIRNKKFIILGALSILTFAFTFSFLGQIVGRKGDDSASYMFAIYCGAELKNLDNYLQNPYYPEPVIFGQNTWAGIYSEFLPAISKKVIKQDFESANGFSLGNVKTAFFPMLLDVGFAFPFFVFLEAFLLCFFIRKAKSTNFWYTGKLNLWVILVAYMYGSAFCSLFSEQFFSSFTIKWITYAIIYWSMIVYFLQGHLGINIKIGKSNAKK